MLTSVRVLMTRVIDYAGLFPPAQLDMPEAFGEYRRHREGAHGWMSVSYTHLRAHET